MIYQSLASKLSNDHPLGTIEADLLRALNECSNWSRQVQFFGMNAANATSRQSIQLDYGIPRKFSGALTSSAYSEADLLMPKGKLMVLGEPGAEKTTPIKRLIQKTLDPDENGGFEKLRFSLLIVLRDYPSRFSIFPMIAARLGLSNHLNFPFRTMEKPYKDDREESVSFRLGIMAIDEFVSDLLNCFQPIVFFDGLEELDAVRLKYNGLRQAFRPG